MKMLQQINEAKQQKNSCKNTGKRTGINTHTFLRLTRAEVYNKLPANKTNKKKVRRMTKERLQKPGNEKKRTNTCFSLRLLCQAFK